MEPSIVYVLFVYNDQMQVNFVIIQAVWVYLSNTLYHFVSVFIQTAIILICINVLEKFACLCIMLFNLGNVGSVLEYVDNNLPG